ncbi:hypothetical protein ESCOCK398M_22610 [Escherichia coli]
MSQLVYFSSSSENTQRFIERLGLPAVRIPLNERERIQVDEPYILIVPSYSGGGTAGAVPRQVIRFLNDEHGNDSNLLIVFYVQIMPDDFVMQLHRF